MFSLGKKICAFCGQPVPSKQALRAPDRTNGFVCRSCYDQWEHTGRTCVECHGPVAGMQDVGAFFEQRALGHADCGGVKLFG
jgi:predicted amidophosphoribosyltransferase